MITCDDLSSGLGGLALSLTNCMALGNSLNYSTVSSYVKNRDNSKFDLRIKHNCEKAGVALNTDAGTK